VNRILGVFDLHQQEHVRRRLAAVLKCVVSQRLARRKDKMGFVPAVEILIANQRVREMILDPEKTNELNSAIEESRETMGMQSFDQSLMDLLVKDLIDYDEALKLTSRPEDFQLKAAGVASGAPQWHEDSGLNQRVRGNMDENSLQIEMDDDERTRS
jgi:twitching motility protein PilT